VIETIEAKDLWVADRNFCTHKFMYAFHQSQAMFVIRVPVHGFLRNWSSLAAVCIV
jgi:hypothetical protein